MSQPELEQRIQKSVSHLIVTLGNDAYIRACQEALLGDDNEADTPRPRSFLPQLVFMIARAANPNLESEDSFASETIYQFAVASYLLDIAAGIFDDFIDADKEYSFVGQRGARPGLLVGLGLWFLAEQQLLKITRLCKKEDIWGLINLLQTLHTNLIGAARGQYLEFETDDFIEPEKCLELTAAKAGLFVGVICKIAAYLAEADQAVCEKYYAFGVKLGIIYQLRNDLHSMYEVEPKRNSLIQKHSTLPLGYAISDAPPQISLEIRRLWKMKELSGEEVSQFQRLIEQGGGIQLTMLHFYQLYQQMERLLTPLSVPDKQLLAMVHKLVFPEANNSAEV